MPVTRLPDLPKAEVAAEQRRQQIAQIRDYYAQLARVDNVAFQLRTANRTFCKKTSAQIGLRAATVRSLPRKFRSYTREALRIGWNVPTALSVADGSPAAVAGIQTGDQILTFDNEALPATGTASWIGKWLKAHGERPLQVMAARRRRHVAHGLPGDGLRDPDPVQDRPRSERRDQRKPHRDPVGHPARGA